jgi:hypothetical protein
MTQGGENIDANVDNLPQIQKVVPKEDMHDPLK